MASLLDKRQAVTDVQNSARKRRSLLNRAYRKARKEGDYMGALNVIDQGAARGITVGGISSFDQDRNVATARLAQHAAAQRQLAAGNAPAATAPQGTPDPNTGAIPGDPNYGLKMGTHVLQKTRLGHQVVPVNPPATASPPPEDPAEQGSSSSPSLTGSSGMPEPPLPGIPDAAASNVEATNGEGGFSGLKATRPEDGIYTRDPRTGERTKQVRLTDKDGKFKGYADEGTLEARLQGLVDRLGDRTFPGMEDKAPESVVGQVSLPDGAPAPSLTDTAPATPTPSFQDEGVSAPQSPQPLTDAEIAASSPFSNQATPPVSKESLAAAVAAGRKPVGRRGYRLTDQAKAAQAELAKRYQPEIEQLEATIDAGTTQNRRSKTLSMAAKVAKLRLAEVRKTIEEGAPAAAPVQPAAPSPSLTQPAKTVFPTQNYSDEDLKLIFGK